MKLADRIQAPLYDIVIPSTQKKAKFRPMYVREERALLAAFESEDESIQLSTLNAVVEATLTPQSAFSSGLTAFDLEYLFTHIRAKSVQEHSTIVLKCDSCEDPNAKARVQIDLRTVEIATPSTTTKGNIIKLNDRMAVQMKYPTMTPLIGSLSERKQDLFQVVVDSIEVIYIDEDTFNPAEESREDLEEFLNKLSGIEYKMLEQFVKDSPYARIPVKYTCPVCKKEHSKYIRGLKNFF